MTTDTSEPTVEISLLDRIEREFSDNCGLTASMLMAILGGLNVPLKDRELVLRTMKQCFAEGWEARTRGER